MPTGADAARGRAAGINQDYILSKTSDLGLDSRFRAVTDSNHGDKRCDANNNSERGEHRAHFVSAQGAECDIKCGCDSHVIRELVKTLHRHMSLLRVRPLP